VTLANSRIIPAAIWLMAALPLLSGCGFFASPDDRAAEAEKLLAAGRYSEAAIEVRTGLDESPSDVRLHRLLARTALALGVLDSAEKAIADAAAAGADEASLGELRAQWLFEKGKPAELLESIDSGKIVLEGDRRESWRVLALGGLNRCEELVPPARALLLREPAAGSVRIAIAECYARLGNRERALAEVNAGLGAKADDANLLLAQARLLAALNQRSQSEAALKRGAEHSVSQLSVPRQVLLQLALVEIHVLHDDVAGMQATHQRLVELAPQAPATDMIGARLQIMQGDLAAAQGTLRRLASADTEPAPVHVLLASVYLAQRSLEQTRLELTWLQQNAPGLDMVGPVRKILDSLGQVPAEGEEYFLRSAAAQAMLGQIDLARAAITAAAGKAPQSIRPAVIRAQLELRAGNPAGALAVTEKLIADHPDNTDVALLHAEALRAGERYAEAEKAFADLYARAPSAGLALTLHRVRVAGGLPGANDSLTSWLARKPDDAAVRGAYADALRLAGDFKAAAAEYGRVVEVVPQNAVALNNLAWVQYQAGDARAAATARRAWKLAPDIATVADTLGWILVESDDVAEGLPLLEQADKAVGLAQPEVRYHHAAALVRAGRRDDARAILGAFLPEWEGMAHYTDASRLLASLGDSGGP